MPVGSLFARTLLTKPDPSWTKPKKSVASPSRNYCLFLMIASRLGPVPNELEQVGNARERFDMLLALGDRAELRLARRDSKRNKKKKTWRQPEWNLESELE